MRRLFLLAVYILLSQCSGSPGPEAFVRGTLEISYRINAPDGDIEPSYQTAVWLRQTDSDSIKTLFVSDYLSYGGFNDSTICPHWSQFADWDNVSTETFDAATRATPPPGDTRLVFELDDPALKPGTYTCNIEIHVDGVLNIISAAELQLVGESTQVIAQPTIPTDADSLFEHLVADVFFKYTP